MLWYEAADAASHHSICMVWAMYPVVMEQLDAARDQLLDEDDELVGRVKDVKEVEKASSAPSTPA